MSVVNTAMVYAYLRPGDIYTVFRPRGHPSNRAILPKIRLTGQFFGSSVWDELRILTHVKPNRVLISARYRVSKTLVIYHFSDAEQIYQAHEDAETTLAKYSKEIANLETLLADSNAAQHEENQAKLRLQSKLRQVEEDRSSMEEQLEDAESAREGIYTF